MSAYKNRVKADSEQKQSIVTFLDCILSFPGGPLEPNTSLVRPLGTENAVQKVSWLVLFPFVVTKQRRGGHFEGNASLHAPLWPLPLPPPGQTQRSGQVWNLGRARGGSPGATDVVLASNLGSRRDLPSSGTACRDAEIPRARSLEHGAWAGGCC